MPRNPLVTEMLRACAKLAHVSNGVAAGEINQLAAFSWMGELRQEIAELSDRLSREDLTADEESEIHRAKCRVVESAVELATKVGLVGPIN